jgi:hypothetical protein
VLNDSEQTQFTSKQFQTALNRSNLFKNLSKTVSLSASVLLQNAIAQKEQETGSSCIHHHHRNRRLRVMEAIEWNKRGAFVFRICVGCSQR